MPAADSIPSPANEISSKSGDLSFSSVTTPNESKVNRLFIVQGGN